MKYIVSSNSTLYFISTVIGTGAVWSSRTERIARCGATESPRVHQPAIPRHKRQNIIPLFQYV